MFCNLLNGQVQLKYAGVESFSCVIWVWLLLIWLTSNKPQLNLMFHLYQKTPEFFSLTYTVRNNWTNKTHNIQSWSFELQEFHKLCHNLRKGIQDLWHHTKKYRKKLDISGWDRPNPDISCGIIDGWAQVNSDFPANGIYVFCICSNILFTQRPSILATSNFLSNSSKWCHTRSFLEDWKNYLIRWFLIRRDIK